MRPPIHGHKPDIFCNKCEHYVDKYTGTIVTEEQVYCLHCQNWLCGEYDLFGDYPSVEHIKMEGEDAG